MKRSFILLLILFAPYTRVSAEDLITFPVAYFAVKCSEILEVEPLQRSSVATAFWQTWTPDCPQLEMFQHNTKGESINQRTIPQDSFCSGIDWTQNPMDSGLQIKLSIPKNLPHGIWYFRATGTAGQSQIDHWSSEWGVCRY